MPKLTMPSLAQFAGAGRVAMGYFTGAVTGAMAAHVITTDQGNTITAAVQQIAGGLTSAAGGIATLVGVGSAIWGAYSHSTKAVLSAVEAMPDVKQVVVHQGTPIDPAVADAVADRSLPKVTQPVAPIPPAAMAQRL